MNKQLQTTLVNWRTSLTAIVTAAAGYVAMFPGQFEATPWAQNLAKFVVVGGLATFGIVAKDGRVTGVPGHSE